MPRDVAGRIAAVWRFPVKSMLGESLDGAGVSASGVAGDRAFALLDVETGLIASAKRPRRWARLLELRAHTVDGETVIEFPDGERIPTGGGEVDERLSAFLDRDVRLVSAPPEGTTFEEVWDPGKRDSPLYGPEVGSEDGELLISLQPSPAAPAGTFFDFSAIHLVTTSSIEALRTAYAEGEVDVRRFRPNLVVEVPEASGYVENAWPQARITIGHGGLTLQGVMRTMRCVMITLGQSELGRDAGMLQAVNRANRVKVGGMGEYACLGIYCTVTKPGRVQVGDEIRVT